MAPLDREVILFLNHFAQHNWNFDQLMTLFARTDVMKGGVVVSVFWWAWFSREHQQRTRELVVATFAGCFIALVLARMLAVVCPFRTRPLADATLGFVRPYGMTHTQLDTWSAFPSDHAALFVGMATGILCISRRLGLFTLSYVLLAICFSRVYLGLHYPSDIVAGGLLGAAMVMLATREAIRIPLAERVITSRSTLSAAFYACFFLVTFQIATLFDGVRAVCNFIFTIIWRT